MSGALHRMDRLVGGDSVTGFLSCEIAQNRYMGRSRLVKIAYTLLIVFALVIVTIKRTAWIEINRELAFGIVVLDIRPSRIDQFHAELRQPERRAPETILVNAPSPQKFMFPIVKNGFKLSQGNIGDRFKTNLWTKYKSLLLALGQGVKIGTVSRAGIEGAGAHLVNSISGRGGPRIKYLKMESVALNAPTLVQNHLQRGTEIAESNKSPLGGDRNILRIVTNSPQEVTKNNQTASENRRPYGGLVMKQYLVKFLDHLVAAVSLVVGAILFTLTICAIWLAIEMRQIAWILVALGLAGCAVVSTNIFAMFAA